MREARAEKDDSLDERRNERQSRHCSGTGRTRRAVEGCHRAKRTKPAIAGAFRVRLFEAAGYPVYPASTPDPVKIESAL
jgi:hypothetical protein